MEETGLSEDVTTRIECGGKEKHDYSIKHEIGRMMPESREIVDTNSLEGSSYHVLANMLEGKNDDGVMVEELTVRNYNNTANLALVKERNQFQHLYRLAGGSGGGDGDKNNNNNNNSVREGNNRAAATEDVENNRILGQDHHANIRTKILSRSGFSEFFVKTTLKGKGIVCRGGSHHHGVVDNRGPNGAGGATTEASPKTDLVASNASLGASFNASLSFDAKSSSDHQDGGVTLREWLKTEQHKVGKVERLFKFRQIAELVENYHSQGVALHDLQPSCFKLLLQPNLVKYIGSTVQSGFLDLDNSVGRRRPLEHGRMDPYSALSLKKQKYSENTNVNSQWPHFTSNHGFKNEVRMVQPHLFSAIDQLEGKWYTSLNEGICTISSNIYSLGVLLFELLGRFEPEKAHVAAMADLRHRILPPKFLSENPKEAGFCLWLLHPEPSSRPSTREILQSDVITGLPEIHAEELAASIDQDDSESELLLHFLSSVKEHKRKQDSKLEEDIKCLEADIKEVDSRHHAKKHLVCSSSHVRLSDAPENKLAKRDASGSEEMRLLKNIVQLEKAYFSTRSKIQRETDSTTRLDKDLIRDCESWRSSSKEKERTNSADPLGAFFGGLCKYARYDKFEVRGIVRTSDFNNSANVICSLSFDRDEDFFASAGVSKKIKIFEFNALLNDSVDIHYPVTEMSNKSKLSCVCWNNYIKNYLASTDYDGVVKLWDATTGQGVSQYMEHEKRAWSVDFSPICPTKLASGSDDCSVKLWGINEKSCLGTIRSIANVCCVQFSPLSTHLLAFGSSDYRTYCYDIRNVRTPWCVLSGHEKAVSYVKFLDSETIVTASTDNSLKLWDLNTSNPSGLSTNACSLTLTGHTNEKNFVGLATGDGYIACGSETNEVYAYHRSLPMPMTSHKFGSIDPISGRETDDDTGLFVSSVCWRGKSDMLVTANSSGCIKVLQMV